MSETYFVSDTHFGHANIIKYSGRPFTSVDQMNEEMIKNWNANVKPGDTVWHLGDFAFLSLTAFKSILAQLNGDIHLVLGNHDKMILQNVREILQQGKIKSIQSYKEIYVKDKFFVLFHYGQRVWNKHHHGAIHLYGHSHGSLPPQGLSVDVGVDCREIVCAGANKTPEEYRPIHVDEVIRYMDGRQSVVVDHHGLKDNATPFDKTVEGVMALYGVTEGEAKVLLSRIEQGLPRHEMNYSLAKEEGYSTPMDEIVREDKL